MSSPSFSPDVLRIDAESVVQVITGSIREQVFRTLRRRGVVLGLSGGIDSSVAAALCVRALGKERVLGLFLPESDSSADSLRLGRLLAESLGIGTVREDLTQLLRAAGCYERRDEAIRQVIPAYGEGWRCKVVLADVRREPVYPFYSVVAESPTGVLTRRRLSAEAHLGILAATNLKQRTRMMLAYHHADRLQYAVVGTPNRVEHDQGFFVKNGDGAADLKPIVHLYKTQVYRLGEHLGIPREIQEREPTSDTYSLPQSQEEFYFALPYPKMDLCLYGADHGVPPAEVAAVTALSEEQVEAVYRLIRSRRVATRYQHLPPLGVDETVEDRCADASRRPGRSRGEATWTSA